HFIPALGDVMPWRLVFAAVVYLVACGFGARFLVRRGGLLPRDPVKRRRATLIAWGASIVVFPATLLFWGADPEAKYLAVSASPPAPVRSGGVEDGLRPPRLRLAPRRDRLRAFQPRHPSDRARHPRQRHRRELHGQGFLDEGPARLQARAAHAGAAGLQEGLEL